MRLPLAICLLCILFPAFGQDIRPYKSNGKWGYAINGRPSIEPQYDTVFPFNKEKTIGMVANKSEFNVVNPLTGEEQAGYDYFFINARNRKVGILPENFPDSVFIFKDQEELAGNYRASSPVFSVLYNSKVYLLSKQGKQLSAGYDHIYQSELDNFFFVENYSEKSGHQVRSRGLVDTSGQLLVKCHCGSLKINPDDSTLYCCSSALSGVNDDVYRLNGSVVHTDKRHVEFASAKYTIYTEYDPKRFIYEGTDGKTKTIEGDTFLYLKDQQALIVDRQEWLILDLLSLKKTKVNKEEYFKKLVTLYYD